MIRWSSGSAWAMSRRKLGTCLTSKKTPEIRITGTNTALTTAGADSKLGIACESATPSAAKQTHAERDEDDQLERVGRPAEAEEDAAGEDDDARSGSRRW